MAQRADELVARIEGRNPISRISKDFAMAEHLGGIPLEELKILVGEPVRVMLAQDNDVAGFSVGETGFASPYTAFQPLTNFPTVDIIRIADTLTLTLEISSDGLGVYGRYIFHLFSDDWSTLDPASVGDTLSIATNTGVLIRANQEPNVSHFSPIGEVQLMLGRTSTNELLIQHVNDHPMRLRTAGIANSNNIGMSAAFDAHAGGILGSRIAALRNFDATHRISIKGRFANRPAAPVTGLVLYDGLEPSFSSPNSGWVLARDADPSGSDPLYYAATTADYDHVYRTWTVDNQEWLIASAEAPPADTSAAFSVQFAEGQAGPWHVPRTNDDLWVRMREPDGTWRSFPFRTEDNSGWELLTTQVFANHSNRWQRRTMGFIPSQYQGFIFQFTNNDTAAAGERHWVFVHPNAVILQTVFTMSDTQQMQARPDNLYCRFRTGDAPFVGQRSHQYDLYGAGTLFSLGFEKPEVDSNECSHAVFGRWSATTRFTFHLYGLRL